MAITPVPGYANKANQQGKIEAGLHLPGTTTMAAPLVGAARIGAPAGRADLLPHIEGALGLPGVPQAPLPSYFPPPVTGGGGGGDQPQPYQYGQYLNEVFNDPAYQLGLG